MHDMNMTYDKSKIVKSSPLFLPFL